MRGAGARSLTVADSRACSHATSHRMGAHHSEVHTLVIFAVGDSTHCSYSTVATGWSKMWPLRQWNVHCCPAGALYMTWMYQKGSAM